MWYFKSKKKYFIIRSTGTQTPEWVWVDLPYVPFYLIKGGRFESRQDKPGGGTGGGRPGRRGIGG